MRLAALIVFGATAAAAGPNAGLFGIVAKDSRPFEQSGGYGAEARFGWAFVDALALEMSIGFTRSQPQSWLLHASFGPKLAPFADSPYSPYLRANVGFGGRTPSAYTVCPAAFGSSCADPNDLDPTFTAAGSVGLDFQVVRGFRISAELGWRRYFFEGGQFPRDLRGLWLGLSLG